MSAYRPEHRDAAECRRLRESHGLSLAQMADVARLSSRQTWAKYEADSGTVDVARWELCLLLLGEHPTLRLDRPQSATTPSG